MHNIIDVLSSEPTNLKDA